MSEPEISWEWVKLINPKHKNTWVRDLFRYLYKGRVQQKLFLRDKYAVPIGPDKSPNIPTNKYLKSTTNALYFQLKAQPRLNS